MHKVICSVRDIAANVYAAPFTSQNIQTALRDFGHACRDPNSALSRNPEDFTLYVIGTFDDDLGVIEPCAAEPIANATQFVKGD